MNITTCSIAETEEIRGSMLWDEGRIIGASDDSLLTPTCAFALTCKLKLCII